MTTPHPSEERYEQFMEQIAAIQRLQAELDHITGAAQQAAKEDLRITPPLLGLGGKLGSGKDAFADILVKHHGFHKLGMSDVLADAMYTLNPYIPMGNAGNPRYQALIAKLGYVEAKKIPEVRRLLQVLGTEVGREMLGENIWVDGARRRIQALREAGHPVVITGIRFPNEIAMITDEGGTTGYVWRTSAEEAAARTAASAHASEQAEPQQFNRMIVNDGSLDDLQILAYQWGSTDNSRQSEGRIAV